MKLNSPFVRIIRLKSNFCFSPAVSYATFCRQSFVCVCDSHSTSYSHLKTYPFMNWYYALNGQQLGPKTESELASLFSGGAITNSTLVWREGLPDWQALSVALPGLVAADAPQIGGVAIPAQDKDLLVQQMREGVTPNLHGMMRFGGFWIRFLAKFIDGIILQAVQMVLGFVVGFAVGAATRAQGGAGENIQLVLTISLGLLGLAINLAYQMIMVGKYGATLGKMALGLKIVRADGSPVSMGLAAGRFFAEFVSSITLLIGYIMAGVDPEKRALHDRICSTRVIKTR